MQMELARVILCGYLTDEMANQLLVNLSQRFLESYYLKRFMVMSKRFILWTF